MVFYGDRLMLMFLHTCQFHLNPAKRPDTTRVCGHLNYHARCFQTHYIWLFFVWQLSVGRPPLVGSFVVLL